MSELLASAWAIIIGFCIIMYVLLDGFDLGIGILFLFFRERHDRNIMVSTVLPVWDGNQTWLVLGGASLYGAFPQAFSLLLPALYLPILIMVIALLFRGITFEFRLKTHSDAALNKWDLLFFISSAVITLTQGLVLGTFVKGFKLGPDYTLIYDLITPFNVTCALALLFGYPLLAATWIIAKTSGKLQKQMFTVARITLFALIFFLIVISLWSPFIDSQIQQIWFNPNYIYKLALLPATTGLLIIYFIKALRQQREYILFWLTIGIFLCAYIGFGISSFPYIIPHVLTIFQMAAPPGSQLVMLIGALLLLPVLLAYTSYSYYVFRGKVTEMIGY